jgi:hypothetical protein
VEGRRDHNSCVGGARGVVGGVRISPQQNPSKCRDGVALRDHVLYLDLNFSMSFRQQILLSRGRNLRVTVALVDGKRLALRPVCAHNIKQVLRCMVMNLFLKCAFA